MLPRTSHPFLTPQDLHKGLGINSGFDYDSRSLCGLLGQRGEGDTHYSKTLDSSLVLIFVNRDLCDSARGHPARPNGGEMSFCIFFRSGVYNSVFPISVFFVIFDFSSVRPRRFSFYARLPFAR